MAQKEFGRRQVLPAGAHSANAAGSSAGASADPQEALALGDVPSRSATRSVMIVAGVGTLVVMMALGAAYGLSGITSPSGQTAAASAEEAAPRQCNGQAGCVNQYTVALACGTGAEPKSVVVEAGDAEAAVRKAERYNRDCRSRSSVFVGALVRSAAVSAFQGQRAGEPQRHAARNTTTTRRWRFRRR